MTLPKTVESPLEKLRQLTRENTLLRKMVAESDKPCIYCQLPKEDMGKCRSGFPGCARADDMLVDE